MRVERSAASCTTWRGSTIVPMYPSYGCEISSGWSNRWITVIGPCVAPFANREVFSRVSMAAPHTVMPAHRTSCQNSSHS